MPYNRINWKNGEAGNTPLNQTNLNHMEDGIKANEGDIAENKSAIDSAELAIDALQLRPTFAIVNTSKSPLKESGSSNILAIDALANSKQNISTKNILPTKGLIEKSGDGVTFTPVYDDNGLLQYINVNRTAPGSSYAAYVIAKYSLEKGSYILNGCPSSGGEAMYMDWRDDVSGQRRDRGQGDAYTSNGQSGKECRIVVLAAASPNNERFYPMIRKANESATYEPYNMPEPGYPVPIVDASGEIKASGKNMLTGWKKTVIQAVGESENPVNDRASCDYVKTYGNPVVISSVGALGNVHYYDEKKNWIVSEGSWIDFRNEPFVTRSGYAYIRISIKNESGTAFDLADIEKYKIQAEAGQHATEYEPYKSDSVNLDGNMLKLPYATATSKINGVQFTVNEDGSVKAEGTATGGNATFFFARRTESNFTVPAGLYTFGGCPAGGSTTSYYMQFQATRNGAFYEYGTDTGNGITADVAASDTLQLTIVVINGVTINQTFYPMLARGRKKADFVPYDKSQHIVLRSQGSAKDELVIYEGGAGKHIQRVGVYVVSETTTIAQSNKAYAVTGVLNPAPKLPGNNEIGNISCDRLRADTSSNTYNGTNDNTISGYNANNWFFRFYSSAFTSADVCKEKMLGAVIYYELATPIVTELTREQVRQILALRTYQPETYIDSDLDVTITYAGDAKSYIDKSNIFTAEERLIGEYLGHPLYRKSYKTKTPIAPNSIGLIVEDDFSDKKVVNLYGVYGGYSFQMPINRYDTSYTWVEYNGIKMHIAGGHTNYECYVTVEYFYEDYEYHGYIPEEEPQPVPLALTEGEE